MTLIENNVVFDNGGRGIQIFKSDHVLVRNNTSYHNVKDPNIEFGSSQGEFMAVYASDVRFINNISAPRDNTVFGFMDVQTDGNDIWDFNLIEDGALPEGGLRKGWDHHNIFGTESVDFVAPSVDPQTANFHLRQGSRAIGAGSVSDAPSEDFSGAPRPRLGPVDLGAFQTSAVGNKEMKVDGGSDPEQPGPKAERIKSCGPRRAPASAFLSFTSEPGRSLQYAGGIGRMIGYMIDAWGNRRTHPDIRVLDSRGPGHILLSPWHFARCLFPTIAVMAPRRPLLHVHVAGRGSTIRKIILVHFARLLRLPIVLHLHDYNYRDSLQRFPKLIQLAARSMFRISSRILVLETR